MKRALLLALSLFAATSCSGGDDDPIVIVEVDATPADASIPVDAAPFVCQMTECGDLCVDTATDPLHCGGCDMACASPGQICTGSTPCECPANFVPAELTGSVMAQGSSLVGLSFIIGNTFDVGAVAYDLNVAIGVEHALGGLNFPAVLAGYDVDTGTFSAHTAYAATSGTITFDNLCAEGASGSIVAPVFEEVEGITNPTPVQGGCSMSYKALTFDFGTCPALPVPDAGVGLDGAVPPPQQ